MYLPTTKAELKELGWQKLDIILVTGDTYIDSPYIGAALLGKLLFKAGYKVGIIAQPDVTSAKDITRLGEPLLFWGVTAGSVDSMVANYTASGRKRYRDDFTPGGKNDRRPDRASIKYTNLIKTYNKNTTPIVLGGIEASLRRVAHYDYWSDKIRRSILFDAKADYLLYGMADRSIRELADSLNRGEHPENIRGLCYISRSRPESVLELPPFDECVASKDAFTTMFNLFYQNNDPVTASALVQKYDNRYLVQNPPARHLTNKELDEIHKIKFERNVHPFYRKQGKVKALETIQFSIPTHRGCYGECNFCAIAVHQGRRIRWRSETSVLNEARDMVSHPDFKGIINDVGGPTANMYGFECAKKKKDGCCPDKRCLFPEVCSELPVSHARQLSLLKSLRDINGVHKIMVSSGIRYDLVIADKKSGDTYLFNLVKHHVSGQLKIAPEHTETRILKLMGKPTNTNLAKFRNKFVRMTREAGKQQYLTYYMIAAHPGCTEEDMQKMRVFARHNLGMLPEQVQVFTPTPSTWSTLMYYTGRDPISGKPVFVERSLKKKNKQKQIMTDRGRQKH